MVNLLYLLGQFGNVCSFSFSFSFPFVVGQPHFEESEEIKSRPEEFDSKKIDHEIKIGVVVLLRRAKN